MAIGRGTSGKRGIGSGKSSHATSGKVSASGYAKKPAGKGNGGPAGTADPGKGRQSKNMGSGGPKYTGPKYGRDGKSKRY